MQGKRTAGAFKRSGLHKLECPQCPGSYVYGTVAQLERHGLPVCPCGAAYMPTEVELAELLELEDCAAVDEYRAEIESIWHGQEAHGKRLGGAKLRDPHDLAMSRITKRRRETARKRRVLALAPVAEPIPF